MDRFPRFAIALASYFYFLYVVLYVASFAWNLSWRFPELATVWPSSIDSSVDTKIGTSVAKDVIWNLMLLGLWAAHHSLAARQPVKQRIERIIPSKHLERSAFVLVASATMHAVISLWRPINFPLYTTKPPFSYAFWAASIVGYLELFLATWTIDHFELFGLKQAWAGPEYKPTAFVTRAQYKHVRHPMMTGILLFMFAVPEMTLGRLVFVGASFGYVILGTWLEERDLVKMFGSKYEQYQHAVPRFIPTLKPYKA